jgi:ribosomal-protein-alanine N-acetyltransferase
MSKKGSTPSTSDKSYQIRPITTKDMDQIYQIETVSFPDAYPYGLLSQLIKASDSLCFLIEVDQKVVGYSLGIMNPEKKGHIISVAVHPLYRHCHYGTLLIDHLIAALHNKGVVTIELEVRVSNTIAQQLYEKFNFQIHRVRSKYYSDGEDAYLMVNKLKE